jgi:clathrin heavy chain
VRIVFQRNQTALIEKWIKEEKLTVTEQLGDLCKPVDPRIALALYIRASVQDKAVVMFAEIGQFEKLQAYCRKFSYTPDWMQIAPIVARIAPTHTQEVLSHITNGGQRIVSDRARYDGKYRLSM